MFSLTMYATCTSYVVVNGLTSLTVRLVPLIGEVTAGSLPLLLE